jgi:hypothetical protein
MTHRYTGNGFAMVDITEAMYANAVEKAIALGRLKNSIREGEGNIVGFLGEEVAKTVFNATEVNREVVNYNYDLLWNGLRQEIKTKDRTVFPKLHHDASVAAYNFRQKTDLYVFVSLYRQGEKETALYTHGFVTGMMIPEEYKKIARFLKKDDYDASNDFTVKADCYNVMHLRLDRTFV